MARVLLGGDPANPRPRSHLLLGVRWQGEHWHADVGFGGGTLLEPLPWGPGEIHDQSGWRYRVIEREPEYVLQGAGSEEDWADIYALLPYPVPKADVETANWWTATHPASRFITGFLVSRQWPDGRRLAISDWGEPALLESTASGRLALPFAREQVPGLLADRFDLPGFALGESGRLVLAGEPRR
jgi:N-hydroxyarylamine O-acetyltransferase